MSIRKTPFHDVPVCFQFICTPIDVADNDAWWSHSQEPQEFTAANKPEEKRDVVDFIGAQACGNKPKDGRYIDVERVADTKQVETQDEGHIKGVQDIDAIPEDKTMHRNQTRCR